MSGSIEFEFGIRPADRRHAARAGSDPLRILVMGDFGGHGRHGQTGARPELAERPAAAIDIDNFDQAMARLNPRLEFSLQAPGDSPADARVELELAGLDDFHPDALYRNLAIFEPLRRMRDRLLDPGTFDEAAAELKRGALAPPSEGPAPPSEAEAPPPEDEVGMLDRLLGGSRDSAPRATGPAPPTGPARDAAEIVRRLVEPHIAPGVDPQQPQLVAIVDDAISRLMRALLHNPAFQEIESSWRALHGLVSGLETGEELRIHLLDVSKSELAADVGGADSDLTASALYRALVESGRDTLGGRPWSLLIGDYGFGASGEDTTLLAALGTIASHAGGPFIAAADPAILGCRSLRETPDSRDWTHGDREAEERWLALRRSSAAGWVGLALPRVIQRLPYGARTDPIESFDFEEMSPRRAHDSYLWGNPAFACARLIAEGFVQEGWSSSPGDRLDLDGLPAHTYSEDGEAQLQACAEVYLSDRAADAILARGLMPVLSHRNGNAIRVARFQSLADPPASLAGPWA